MNVPSWLGEWAIQTAKHSFYCFGAFIQSKLHVYTAMQAAYNSPTFKFAGIMASQFDWYYSIVPPKNFR